MVATLRRALRSRRSSVRTVPLFADVPLKKRRRTKASSSHSSSSSSPPRASSPPKTPPRRTDDAYGTAAKANLRDMVCRSRKLAPNGQLIYLESPDAGATRAFLAEDVAPSGLTPVNWCKRACAAIHDATGVRAKHANLLEYLRGSPGGAPRHVVWLDLEQNTVADADLAAAFRVARVVHLTLSTHTLQWQRHLRDTQEQIQRVAKAEGVRVRFALLGTYPGKSGWKPMLHLYFTVGGAAA
jgi:hypothetical protein